MEAGHRPSFGEDRSPHNIDGGDDYGSTKVAIKVLKK
jgi:hypothetical protein